MNEREHTIKNSGSSILETSTNSQINKAELSFLQARKKLIRIKIRRYSPRQAKKESNPRFMGHL